MYNDSNENRWQNLQDCNSCNRVFSISSEHSPLFNRPLAYCHHCGWPYFNQGKLTAKGEQLKIEFDFLLDSGLINIKYYEPRHCIQDFDLKYFFGLIDRTSTCDKFPILIADNLY